MSTSNMIPKRNLGRTGLQVSAGGSSLNICCGLGLHHRAISLVRIQASPYIFSGSVDKEEA